VLWLVGIALQIVNIGLSSFRIRRRRRSRSV
jgi:hypothetical protein